MEKKWHHEKESPYTSPRWSLKRGEGVDNMTSPPMTNMIYYIVEVERQKPQTSHSYATDSKWGLLIAPHTALTKRPAMSFKGYVVR